MVLEYMQQNGFIDDTIPRPSLGHRDYGVWFRCDDIVLSCMYVCVVVASMMQLLYGENYNKKVE